MSRRVPVGVVGVIAPFNVPTILSIRAVAPALALGNAVLLKPDPRTAVCRRRGPGRDLRPGRAARRAAARAAGRRRRRRGAGRPSRSSGSSRSPGSTSAGRAVPTLAAQHLKRVHLELGGNSALLVLDDVDVEAASSVGAWGSFAHQGQVCMAAGRHLVQSRVADDYIAALADTGRPPPGRRPDLGDRSRSGPVIDAGQRDKIHAMVTESVDAGARLAAGGTYEDLYYRPTVLADVPTTAPAYTEEIFGPVAPVVRFDSVEDVVRLAARHRLRPLTGDPDPRCHARAGDRRADPERARAHQRPDHQRRGDDPVRRRPATPGPGRVLAARRPTSTPSPTRSGCTVRGRPAGVPDVADPTALSPRPRRPSRQRAAAWPPARRRSARCPRPSRRTRTAARGTAGRAGRTSPPRRCVASAGPCPPAAPRFVVTSPRTTCLPGGTNRSGSKPPDRSSSNSRKKPSTSSSAEQRLGDEVVAALGRPRRAEVPAAHVGRDAHAVGPAGEGRVDVADVLLVLVLGVAAALGDQRALLGVVEVGQAGVVELQVRAAERRRRRRTCSAYALVRSAQNSSRSG